MLKICFSEPPAESGFSIDINPFGNYSGASKERRPAAYWRVTEKPAPEEAGQDEMLSVRTERPT